MAGVAQQCLKRDQKAWKKFSKNHNKIKEFCKNNEYPTK
ncbi:hypothetical protein B4096_2241 [Heyndrickxia coagulans]|uniref:Uncharacterized protein n=1 Tax=Heyndrickxia coagulans TaxID=1398 RepID=A0AAN0T4B2_HEYCO|nr:hypothetical protein SB48_HM08orf01588 [Heyndrickxia coagulans]KYC79756.1 hypothetical protein B4096_2241 [Heyndrickxia coagulans]